MRLVLAFALLVCATAIHPVLKSSFVEAGAMKPVQPHKGGKGKQAASAPHDFNTMVPCAEPYLPALAAFTNAQAAATGGVPLNAPLKQKARGGEKVGEYLSEDLEAGTYSGGGGVGGLTDMVRSSIIYDNYGDLLAAVPKLKAAAKKGVNTTVSGNEFEFRFCRVKNRFANPVGRYMDFLNNICIIWSNISTQKKGQCGYYHVGEIQLHVKPIIAAKEGGASWLGDWAAASWQQILSSVSGNPQTQNKKGKNEWAAGHYYYEVSRSSSNATVQTQCTADADKLYIAAGSLSGSNGDLDSIKALTQADFVQSDSNQFEG